MWPEQPPIYSPNVTEGSKHLSLDVSRLIITKDMYNRVLVFLMCKDLFQDWILQLAIDEKKFRFSV